MAAHNLQKLKYDGQDIIAEVAIRDDEGRIIQDTYATKSDIPDDYVDLSNNQEIDGQKDFKVNPRVCVTHEGHNLPEDYIELTYVETDGTQYIDTSLTTSSATKIELDYLTLKDLSAGFQNLFGSTTNAGTAGGWFAYLSGASKIALSYNTAGGATNPINNNIVIDYNTRHIFAFEKEKGYLDGSYIGSCVVGTATSTSNLWLLARNSSSPSPSVGRLYEAKFWNNEDLVRDFIPAKQITDGTVGLYDIVNNIFYISIGSEEFIAGPEFLPVTYENLLTDANFADVAFSGNYNDLSNRPSIPTVYNGALTIKQNNTSVGTFTANSSTSPTINITTPTTVEELTDSDEYAKVEYVDSEIQDVREVAEGKTATYVVDDSTNPIFNTQDNTIVLTEPLVDISGNIIELDKLRLGDNIYVTDTGVPDRWVSLVQATQITLSKLETAKPPVSDVQINGTSIIHDSVANIIGLAADDNVVHLTGDEIISGQKDFNITPRVWVWPTEQIELPDGYTQVEYIESSGQQYINTNFSPKDKLPIVELKFKLTQAPSNIVGLFGMWASGDKRFQLHNNSIGIGTYATVSWSSGLIYNVIMDAETPCSSVNGVVNTSSYTNKNNFGDYPLYLFTRNNGGSTDPGAPMQLYSCKISNNGELVHNYIPCIQDNDNTVGLYDIVTDTFETNDGSGAFIAGPPVEGHYESMLTSGSFADVAFSGSYNDLVDKPTIPTVNNGVLTIKQNNVSIGTFSANSATSPSVNITVPTKTSDITNDSDFITSDYHDTSKQDTLVSGDNIKTINNESILGSGNIEIDGASYTAGDGIIISDENEISVDEDIVALKTDIPEDYVDLTSNQVINGQKDFEILPRVKVERQLPDLPENYRPVEYVEGTGSQFINTGIQFVDGDEVEIEAKMGVVSADRGIYTMYPWNNPTNSRFMMGISSGINYWAIAWNDKPANSDQGILLPKTDADQAWHTWKLTNHQCQLSDLGISTGILPTYNQGSGVCYLFYGALSPTPSMVKYLKHWDSNGNLKIDLIPCIRTTDNAVGFYDTVRKGFLANAGSGTFIAGPSVAPTTYQTVLTRKELAAVALSGEYSDLLHTPDIPDDYVDLDSNQLIDGQKDFEVNPRVKITHETHDLPNDYVELEYIESNGTQYLDTGYKVTANTIFELDAQFLAISSASQLHGQFGPNSANSRCQIGIVTNRWSLGYGSIGLSGATADTTRHNFIVNGVNKVAYVDDQNVGSYSGATFTPLSSNLVLFGRVGTVTPDPATPVTGRIYSCKLYTGDQLERHFIPAKRVADSECGLFDIINNKFYSRAAGVNFVAGSEIQPVSYERLITDGNFAQVAFTGNYRDLVNQPTIPTVNDGTLTVQRNGIAIGTFSANSVSNPKINVIVPTTVAELDDEGDYAKVDYVDEQIEDVREVAEGKTATYVVSMADNPVFNSQEVTIVLTSSIIDVGGKTIDIDQLRLGDNVYVIELDVPDRWVSLIGQTQVTLSRLETAKPAVSDVQINGTSIVSNSIANITGLASDEDVVHLTGNEIILGQKDFIVTPRVRFEHETHNLPAEYQEVEYLESTGTQYISTGYTMTNDNLSFDINLMPLSLPSSANFFLGYRSTSSATVAGNMRAFFIYGSNPVGRLAIRYGAVADNSTATLTINKKVNITFDGTNLFVDDIKFINVTTKYTTPVYKEMYLFTANASGYYSSDISNFIGRLYTCKLWQDNELVRELIPCYRKADHKTGLYDLVNSTFYSCLSTTEFNVGQDIYPTVTYESLLTDANFSNVAFTGDYNDLLNKPVIPTVNNGTLTIKQNNVSVGTFTANSATSPSVNITVPTKTSELQNDSGYINDLTAVEVEIEEID